MNKKFLSAILFGALMVTSTGTFVSCKDYDDDIETVQGQVNANKSALTALESQLTSLQSAAAAAQTAADAAKAAAQTAQAAGNDAKAAAEEAKAAAAQAKVDAIAEATAKVEALKAWVAEQGYASKEELAVAIAAVNGQIEGIEAGLSDLTDYVLGLEEQLGLLSTTTLSNIVALQEDLATQAAAIETLMNSTTDEALAAKLDETLAFVTEVQNTLGQSIGSLANRLDDLDETLAGKFEEQETFFAQLSQVVNTLVTDLDSKTEELWAEINGEGANSIRSQVGQLANVIATVQGELATLHIAVDTQLTSLAFIPEVLNTHGLGVVEFYSLELKDADDETVYVSNVPTATYRVNPTNAAQADYTWSFINRSVETRAAGDASDLLTITKSEGVAGSRTFWLQADKEVVDELEQGKTPIFALKATKGDREIVSDYATVTIKTLKNFALAQLDEDGEWLRYLPSTETAAKGGTAVAELVYTSELDLKPIVEAWSTELSKALVDINVEDIEYEFTEIEKYLGTDGVTDQQKFVTLTNGVVKVDNEWLSQGTAAIGRTPIIKAVATVNDIVIATGYIKVAVVAEPSEEVADKEDLVLNVNLGNIEYTTINGVNQYRFDWARANAEVYDVLGLTKASFQNNYYDASLQQTPTGVEATAWTWLYASSQNETAMAWINIDPTVEFGENTVNVTYPSKDKKTYPNVVIKFNYNIVHTTSLPALNPDYLIGTNTIQVKGKMVGNTWKLVSEMDEHFVNYLAGYELPKNHTKFFFRLKEQTPAQTGATISGNDYTDQKIELTTALDITESYRDYNVQAVATLANGEECVYDYVVRFVRPFNATVSEMKLKTFIANPDTKDLAKLVVIKDLDNQVIYENGAYTQYAADTYKITAASGIGFDYAIDADESFGTKLTISGSEVTWFNGGADLQQNKTAASVVEITIPNIATIEVEGVITVLSTENSKN